MKYSATSKEEKQVSVCELRGLSEDQWHEERAKDVTSSESAALFGESPYCTMFELWHRKRGALQVERTNGVRQMWGNRLEPAIAAGIAEDQGWTIAPMKWYARSMFQAQYPIARDDGACNFMSEEVSNRFGSSFDYEVLCPRRGVGILELKNVDWMVAKDQWQDDEAPAHIEIQLQHQLEVYEGQYAWGAIGALVGGNSPRVLIRDYDREVGASIRTRVAKFWASVSNGKEPAPRFPADAETIIRLHGFAEPGKVYDGRSDERLTELLSEYARAASEEKLAQQYKEEMKASILRVIGDAEAALGNGFKVWASMVGPAHVEYDRAGYRGFRVTKLSPRKEVQ